MSEYTITLPTGNNVHKPNCYTLKCGDIKLALSAFDTDGYDGLDPDELFSAFDYFVNKEKEIAMVGKKGDNIITSKDIEQIIKTDSKFSYIKEKFGIKNATELLSNVVITLSALVQYNPERKIQCVSTNELIDDYSNTKAPHEITKNTKCDIKDVNGKKVKTYLSNSQAYVKSLDDKYIYTNPEFVAKCFDYKTESTWLGLGKNRYYVIQGKPGYLSIGNGGHEISDLYKQYKVWNENNHSFSNGEYEYYQTVHFSGHQ